MADEKNPYKGLNVTPVCTRTQAVADGALHDGHQPPAFPQILENSGISVYNFQDADTQKEDGYETQHNSQTIPKKWSSRPGGRQCPWLSALRKGFRCG